MTSTTTSSSSDVAPSFSVADVEAINGSLASYYKKELRRRRKAHTRSVQFLFFSFDFLSAMD